MLETLADAVWQFLAAEEDKAEFEQDAQTSRAEKIGFLREYFGDDLIIAAADAIKRDESRPAHRPKKDDGALLDAMALLVAKDKTLPAARAAKMVAESQPPEVLATAKPHRSKPNKADRIATLTGRLERKWGKQSKEVKDTRIGWAKARIKKERINNVKLARARAALKAALAAFNAK